METQRDHITTTYTTFNSCNYMISLGYNMKILYENTKKKKYTTLNLHFQNPPLSNYRITYIRIYGKVTILYTYNKIVYC